MPDKDCMWFLNMNSEDSRAPFTCNERCEPVSSLWELSLDMGGLGCSYSTRVKRVRSRDLSVAKRKGVGGLERVGPLSSSNDHK